MRHDGIVAYGRAVPAVPSPRDAGCGVAARGYSLGHDAERPGIAQESLALPDKERADLAGSLIDSLDDTVDENAEAAWQEEIVRRLEDVQSRKVKTTSWDEVRQKGRTLLRNR